MDTRGRMPVWLVEEGDYEGVWVVGVYESFDAARAHHPGDWKFEHGAWMIGDSSGGTVAREVEVKGTPVPPQLPTEAERASEREQLRAEVRRPLPYEERSTTP